MKKYIFLYTIAILITSCDKSKKNDTCKNKAIIEETEICLPEIKSLNNIFDKKDNNIYIKYSDIISTFTTVGNGLLAFYVEKSDAGYSCLYYNKKVGNDLSIEEYKIMSEKMGEYLKKADYLEKINETVEKEFLKNISLDVPVSIEKYSLNDNVTTYLMLGKKNEQNEDIYTLTSLNLIYLKNKMVIFNYTVKYNDFKTINKLKQKNDYFVTRLLNCNE